MTNRLGSVRATQNERERFFDNNRSPLTARARPGRDIRSADERARGRVDLTRLRSALGAFTQRESHTTKTRSPEVGF